MKSFVFTVLGLVMPFALILSVLTKQAKTLKKLIGEKMVETLHIYTVSDHVRRACHVCLRSARKRDWTSMVCAL